MSTVTDLEPKLLWKHFDEIRKVPHPSGNEEKLGEYMKNFAKSMNLEYDQDTVGNLVIRKPASLGYENVDTVILQGHLDMVGEKNSDKEFDFERDQIELIIEDEWLTANGTTLGSDNGIGLAATLAILEDNNLNHGPLEALFTIDEERGLVGASNLSKDFIKGRRLINLDSEEIGVFSIGCAGGGDLHISLPVKYKQPRNDVMLDVHLFGLRGGHSGIDIHEGRGNALKILNRLLYQLDKDIPIEISCIEGGDKHNAIPRETFAKIAIPGNKKEQIQEWFARKIKEIQTEFSPIENNIQIKTKESQQSKVLKNSMQKSLFALIFGIPHGPLAMSRKIAGLVETSNNLASIKCLEKHIKFVTSSRSSNDNALSATLDKITAVSELAGCEIEKANAYPGWMPDLESKILQVALRAYKDVTGTDAKYEAIHAGLECGLIGEKYPGMDMISVGPTIKHPHSPEERVHIGSIQTFYQHVVRMIEILANEKK
jgi:dipeptidase D